MIHFKCSTCSEELEAPESMKGESLQCPSCGLSLNIPTSEEKPASLEIDRQDLPKTEDLPEPPPPSVETSKYRLLKVESIGEVVLNKSSKSIKCPLQQGKRCDFRCAWFSIDNETNLARCQNTIIGEVVKNEYHPESA